MLVSKCFLKSRLVHQRWFYPKQLLIATLLFCHLAIATKSLDVAVLFDESGYTQKKHCWQLLRRQIYQINTRASLLLTRVRSDNVEPCASSVSAMNLLRLAQYTEYVDLREKAEKTLQVFGGNLHQSPTADVLGHDHRAVGELAAEQVGRHCPR